jgi:hypothetical protein
MVCYQVLAQFAFSYHNAALVSTHIKKQTAQAFLVLSGLPFGHSLKYCRFFKTKKETARYVSYLHTVYKNRIMPYPAQNGTQNIERVPTKNAARRGAQKRPLYAVDLSSPALPGGQLYLF